MACVFRRVMSLFLLFHLFAFVMGYHSVFVYGTLKTGEPNHHWFSPKNGEFKFISKASTVEKYPLIIGTRYNIPFLLYSPGNGTIANCYGKTIDGLGLIVSGYIGNYRCFSTSILHVSRPCLQNVIGEMYQVDDKMLANLDVLEEHPNFYVREIKSVTRLDTNETCKCWIYFLKQFRPELLTGPFYSEYSSTGDHGLKYAERYLRDPNHPARAEVRPD